MMGLGKLVTTALIAITLTAGIHVGDQMNTYPLSRCVLCNRFVNEDFILSTMHIPEGKSVIFDSPCHTHDLC